MTWAQLATFNIILIVAIASPGPAMLMATQTSLSAGRAAGTAVGAGLGLMAAIWTMMALLGFGVVSELFPFLYVGAKVVGAAYLLYIAFRMWKSTQGAYSTQCSHPVQLKVAGCSKAKWPRIPVEGGQPSERRDAVVTL